MKIAPFFVLLTLLFLVGCDTADTPATPPALKSKSVVSEATNTESRFTSQELQKLRNIIKSEQRRANIPGIAVAVIERDQVIFVEGFGVRSLDTQEPVTPETLFHIGSTHKSITAMLWATIIDEGRFSWDMPVTDIYPDFRLSDPQATSQLRLHHLLNMTSGIPDDTEALFDAEYDSPTDLFDLLAEAELSALPGEDFSYSNLTSSAAGYLAVLADGGDQANLYEGYEATLQRRILDPIGMQNATLSVDEARRRPDYAVGHIYNDDDEVVVAESYDVVGDALAPSGGLKANVQDMAAYLSTQLNHGVAPNGQRIVSADSLHETWQPYLEEYALGWEIRMDNGDRVISHEGSYDSFNSLLMFSPKRNVGLVILTNTDEPDVALVLMAQAFIALSR
ncbi:serine hydrolase domain-containing protein [Anaerolineales bacterium HSG6]|nr:serine hydrolase domain-containing protein [Anaerolineales bacterium HSG6]